MVGPLENQASTQRSTSPRAEVQLGMMERAGLPRRAKSQALQRMVQKSSMTNNNCHALMTLVYRRACSNPTKNGQFLVRELTLSQSNQLMM